jgi:hypothetical protein
MQFQSVTPKYHEIPRGFRQRAIAMDLFGLNSYSWFCRFRNQQGAIQSYRTWTGTFCRPPQTLVETECSLVVLRVSLGARLIQMILDLSLSEAFPPHGPQQCWRLPFCTPLCPLPLQALNIEPLGTIIAGERRQDCSEISRCFSHRNLTKSGSKFNKATVTLTQRPTLPADSGRVLESYHCPFWHYNRRAHRYACCSRRHP